MEKFQLYKKRDFNAVITDTLQFFKLYWKNYFASYSILLGGLLLVCLVVSYMYLRSSATGSYEGETSMEILMGNLSKSVMMMAVISIYTIVSLAFPMAYLALSGSSDRDSFSASELFAGVKARLLRIFLFGIFGTFTLGILTLLFFVIGGLLCIIIIGIPILIAGTFIIIVWTMQSMYIYVEEEAEFFYSLSRGWKVTFSNLWGFAGSTAIVALVISFVSSIFLVIPMLSSIVAAATTGKASPMILSPLMTFVYLFGTMLSYVLYNVIYVQQGMIYYSSVEESEHIQAYAEIDNIGQHNEE